MNGILSSHTTRLQPFVYKEHIEFWSLNYLDHSNVAQVILPFLPVFDHN